MRSRWIAVVPLLVAALVIVPTESSISLRQSDLEPECVDLQCPKDDIDNGVKNLIDEESESTRRCFDCSQCTTNGYSVCIRLQPNRALRMEDGGTSCSCAHSVPANCHIRLTETPQSVNFTMKTYSVCYMSSLQAPPRPSAASEKTSVVFTIEPFWLEPYWRELVLDNLIFHYDFPVKAPEHCEGVTVSSDDGHHLCTNSIPLNITVGGVTNEDLQRDEDYEHSEDYDVYDDDLPEEVDIDRAIFGDAPYVQVYFLVDVNRPRQLNVKAGSSGLIYNTKTTIESEILKYDLISGSEPMDELPPLAGGREEDDDVSSEKSSIEFPADDKPVKYTNDEGKAHRVTGKENTYGRSTEEEENVSKTPVEADQNKEENADASSTVAESSKIVETFGEHEVKKEEENEADETKKHNDDTEHVGVENSVIDDAIASTMDIIVNAKHEEQRVVGEMPKKESAVETGGTGEDITNESLYEDDYQEDSDENYLAFIERIVRDKGLLARWVFGVTITVCLLFIVCVCVCRRRSCKKRKEGNKTSSAHRYSSINGQPLVVPPEKERLNQ